MGPLELQFHQQAKERQARLMGRALPLKVRRELPAPPAPPQPSAVILQFTPTWQVDGPLTIADIQTVVSQHYKISRRELTGPRRNPIYTFPRQVAMYLCRAVLKKSFPYIGLRFGGRHHTTILHAFNAITVRLHTDPQLAADVAALRKLLGVDA